MIRKVLSKSCFSILDQGIFAITNFAINVLLARWMVESDYGYFTVGFSFFLLLGVVYNSLLVEPLIVFGSGRFREAFQNYLRKLETLHWSLAAPAIVLLGLAISLGHSGSEAFQVILWFSILGTVILRQWFYRRACYVRLEPEVAVQGGLVYLTSVGLGLVLCLRWFGLDSFNAILLMSGASLVSTWWIKRQLHSRSRQEASTNVETREILSQHWDYGRWALLTGAIGWIPANIYFVYLPQIHGPESAAALKASFNLALPFLQVVTSIAVLLVPLLIKRRGSAEFSKVVLYASGALVGGSLLYSGFVYLFGAELFHLLYQKKFAGYGASAYLVTLVLVPSSTLAVLASALRSLELPKLVVYGYVGSAIASITLGVWLMTSMEVKGSILGMIVSSSVASLILWRLLRRQLAIISAP